MKDVRMCVRDEERTGRSFTVNDVLVQEVEKKKSHENRRFTITLLSTRFPRTSRFLLREILSMKLNFRQLCAHVECRKFLLTNAE